MIEICIPTFQRPERIPLILKQLKEQTYKDFNVNIWDNSGTELHDLGSLRGMIVEGKGNEGSKARFYLVKKTKGNPIIFLDDDENIEKDFIEYNYEQYKRFGKDCILGWYSKKWNGEDYRLAIEDRSGCLYEEVDYVGTGGMILDRDIFDKEESLQNIPPEYAKAEDLYLCAIARMKYNMKIISIEKKCQIVNDRKDQYGGLKQYKQDAFNKLRKEGWKLKKEL